MAASAVNPSLAISTNRALPVPSKGVVDRVALCYHFDVSQPVKLSDELVLDARLAGENFERSINGQIEFWAQLGRAIEPMLRAPQIIALRRAGAERPVSACLSTVDSDDGRQRVKEYLKTVPFPHYEASPDRPGLLIRTEADGSRTLGRFVKRQFVPAE